MDSKSPQPHSIQVTVSFALAPRPYQHTYPAGTHISVVQSDALAVFHVTPDANTRYELVHHEDIVPVDKTVGEIAGHEHELRLKLRTETISG